MSEWHFLIDEGADMYLQIKHVKGKVEVTGLSKHGGDAITGTLVLDKPSDYDSLSQSELEAKLPPLGAVEDKSSKGKKSPKPRKR